ncbi:polysaccharide deacetylase family protein [Streptomyces mirabilis]|uniref:polysaccharide deacetylase family protein n=1 Tax=Streptomyces mirabilis TaxID=68239 RepID=UPI003692D44C
MTSTQSPRYPFSPIWARQPLKLPDGKRMAVLVYLNIEHFPYDQPQLAYHFMHPGATKAAPDVLNSSWRDCGMRVGLWRIVEVLERYGFPVSVFLHSDACAEYPEVIEYGVAHGWEWIGHGINTGSVPTGMSEDEERAMVTEVLERVTEATGTRPQGWFSAAISQSYATPDILTELGIRYVCDYSADDQPFPVTVSEGSLVSVPYRLPTVDVVQLHENTAEQYADNLIEQFEVQYEESADSARIMPISLHPFVVGEAYRIRPLARALKHIASRSDVWLAQGHEISTWYQEAWPKGHLAGS